MKMRELHVRLMEEFPLSEELVEWDLLLDNR